MTEGADEGAALPCSPWAGDAADCCQDDAVLSQALRGEADGAFWPLVEPSLCPAVAVCPSMLIRDARVAPGVILIDHDPNA